MSCVSTLKDLDVNFDAISQRELKLHFLQIITPGQVYPERCTSSQEVNPDMDQPMCSVNKENSSLEGQRREVRAASGSQDTCTSPIPGGGKEHEKFKVDDFGLTWETIETMHFFIFPGELSKFSADLPPTPHLLMQTLFYIQHFYFPFQRVKIKTPHLLPKLPRLHLTALRALTSTATLKSSLLPSCHFSSPTSWETALSLASFASHGLSS